MSEARIYNEQRLLSAEATGNTISTMP